MIQAYAAKEPGGKFTPFSYDPGPLGAHEVEIQVEHCGICHSDLSVWKNDWGNAEYPLVPGHEVVGVISAVGKAVENLAIGERVGLGWHAGYCMSCKECMSGDHNLCKQSQASIIGHFGGFADKVRAQSFSVFPLPEKIDSKVAGPLFCGGVTVFNPLVQLGIQPTDHVAVIGIGGLGHLALQFCKAWGCEVTAFTSSDSKKQEAIKLGANHTINSRDFKGIEQAKNSFDLVLSTVNVKLDWNAYLETLKPKGHLHFLGATLEPLDLQLFPMLSGQLSVSSSPVGSPETIQKMLEFAARHNIKPITEHFPFSQINEAMEHLQSGKARYRVVLSR